MQVPRQPEPSFVETDTKNIVVTAVKREEDDSSLVLRYYRSAGKAGTVKLHLPRAVSSATETNLMENPITNLPPGTSALTIRN
jgi:alpha-mannosidase